MSKTTKERIVLLLLCLFAAVSVIKTHKVYASSASNSSVSANLASASGKWVYVGEKGYYKKSSGVLYRGWLSWNNHIYYLSKRSGEKAVGFHTINGKRYYFRENSGRLKADGWFKVDGERYYAASDGTLKTGWFKKDGEKYFFSKKGVMRTGWVKINHKKYYFYPNGEMSEKIWLDKKHYVNENGALETMNAQKRKSVFRWPLNAKWNYISSYFGYRGPMSVGTSNHDGIDIPANMNTPICAARTGTVIVRESNDSAGNHIEIDHHNGFITEYMHMTRFKPGIKEGSKVKKGQVIGYVGSTGWSTGPHLHFGVRLNDVDQDPLEFVRQP